MNNSRALDNSDILLINTSVINNNNKDNQIELSYINDNRHRALSSPITTFSLKRGRSRFKTVKAYDHKYAQLNWKNLKIKLRVVAIIRYIQNISKKSINDASKYMINEKARNIRKRKGLDYLKIQLFHFKKIWDMIIFAFIIYFLIIFPYKLALKKTHLFMDVVEAISDIILTIDAIYDFAFNYDIVNEVDHVLQVSLKDLLDLPNVLLLSIRIIISFPLQYAIKEYNYVKLIRIIEVFRFFKGLDIVVALIMVRFSGSMDWLDRSLILFKCFITFSILAHLFVCLFIALGYEHYETSWIAHYDAIGNVSQVNNVSTYIEAFYFTIYTFSTVGYTNITPKYLENIEYLFLLIMQMVGLYLYTKIRMTLLIIEMKTLSRIRLKEREEKEVIIWLCRLNNNPEISCIQKDIWDDIKDTINQFRLNCNLSVFDQNHYYNLPYEYQNELVFRMFGEYIELFNHVFVGVSIEFIDEILVKLASKVFEKNLLLAKKGKPINGIFFIQSGSLLKVVHNDTIYKQRRDKYSQNNVKYIYKTKQIVFADLVINNQLPKYNYVVDRNSRLRCWFLSAQNLDEIKDNYSTDWLVFKKNVLDISVGDMHTENLAINTLSLLKKSDASIMEYKNNITDQMNYDIDQTFENIQEPFDMKIKKSEIWLRKSTDHDLMNINKLNSITKNEFNQNHDNNTTSEDFNSLCLSNQVQFHKLNESEYNMLSQQSKSSNNPVSMILASEKKRLIIENSSKKSPINNKNSSDSDQKIAYKEDIANCSILSDQFDSIISNKKHYINDSLWAKPDYSLSKLNQNFPRIENNSIIETERSHLHHKSMESLTDTKTPNRIESHQLNFNETYIAKENLKLTNQQVRLMNLSTDEQQFMQKKKSRLPSKRNSLSFYPNDTGKMNISLEKANNRHLNSHDFNSNKSIQKNRKDSLELDIVNNEQKIRNNDSVIFTIEEEGEISSWKMMKNIDFFTSRRINIEEDFNILALDDPNKQQKKKSCYMEILEQNTKKQKVDEKFKDEDDLNNSLDLPLELEKREIVDIDNLRELTNYIEDKIDYLSIKIKLLEEKISYNIKLLIKDILQQKEHQAKCNST